MGCMTPVTPQDNQYARSSVAMQDEMSFRASIECGKNYRTKNSIQNVAQIAVSPGELRRVETLVEDLRKTVTASLDTVTKTKAGA
jgi:hypothetical protein